MKITKKNYKDFVKKDEWERIESLFKDVEDVNKYTDMKLYIEWQDYHDEYSFERTDPCPDYYGYYRLKFEGMSEDCVGDVMTLDELDNAICVLFSYNFLQNLGSDINNSIIC